MKLPRSTPPPVVRRATASDLDALAALTNAHPDEDPPGMRRRFEHDLGDPEHRPLFVAVAPDGELVGYGRTFYLQRPRDANPAEPAPPTGWYLGGLLTARDHRRLGIGRALTEARLEHIFARADVAYYFTNARNAASRALHEQLGFVELTRDFWFPGVTFESGDGVLSRANRPAA